MKKYLKNLIIKFMLKRHKRIRREERHAIIKSKILIDNPDSELLIHPSRERYYIKLISKENFVIIEFELSDITIINNTYCHNVKLSERAKNIIENNFLAELDKRIYHSF